MSSYLYLLPALILVVGVVHVGIVANAYYSTLDWNGVSPDASQVGVGNYVKLLQDPVFWTALRNTFAFAVATIALQMLFGFVLATLVRTRTVLRGLLRTLAFVPVVLAPAVVATSFRFLLTPDGSINDLLSIVTGQNIEQAWLADPNTALTAIILINVWQYTGYSFLIYDAAMGQIDTSIIEAARIDGASSLQLLRLIVAPLLSGSHLVLVVLGVISALKTFDLVYLTTAGGPGTSTQVLTGYIYRQVIEQFHAGYGAALSMALVVLALIFAVLQVRLTSRKVN
ncbi:carbohydrate ABC transporter permease [Plantibacter flavus]|uniref:carbohydrate ABC transporter permease n=1 Tax=Plantibacter flavus TaxID=150123 RepID=UPI00099C0D2F|nr:sugar ABC transporter permease [Plantibacter flavus]